MFLNSIQIFLFVFFAIFQHVRTYNVPPSSSSSASDSGSIDWDEYINWPKDEAHPAHHDDHMVKPKGASDRHSSRSNDLAKPIDKHAGSVSPGPQPANQKKRKSPSPSSPASDQSAASPTSGKLTDKQMKKMVVNRNYYVRNQVELRKKRNEKYHRQKSS